MPCTHADRTSTAASDARAVWARVQVCACGGRISFCGNSADHNCRNPKQLHCIVYGCDLRAMNAFLG